MPELRDMQSSVGTTGENTDPRPGVPGDGVRSTSKPWHERVPLGAIPFLTALGIWWWLSGSESRRVQHIVPDLGGTWNALASDISSGVMARHGWVTFQEILWGFLVALVGAIVTGLLFNRFAVVRRMLFPSVVFLQALPKVAVAPLLVTWFGFGLSSKVATAGLIAFFPMLIGVITGLEAARVDEIDLLRSLGASKMQTLTQVQIPRALPAFIGGVEVGFVFSIVGAIVGELVGAQAGLGYLILFRSTQLDLAGMFSALIVLSALGVLADLGIKALGSRIVFWEGH